MKMTEEELGKLVEEKVIAKAIDEKMSYLVGKVKQSDTKNKIRKEVTK